MATPDAGDAPGDDDTNPGPDPIGSGGTGGGTGDDNDVTDDTADDDGADDDDTTDDDMGDDDATDDDMGDDDDGLGGSSTAGARGDGGGKNGTGGASGSGGVSSGGSSGSTGGAAPVPCADGEDCDNGLRCDGVETCEDGFCAPGTPEECDDGVECTLDVCSATTDECEFIPQNSQCSDGVFCNGVELCDLTQGCQPGTPPNCVDSVDCTMDSCDEENDRCRFEPDHSICADATFCNGDEVCDPGAGCQSGPARNCNDDIACTIDSCDEGSMSCVHTPDNLACSNGVFCDGQEVCTAGVGCEDGDAVTCNSDGIACTADACREALMGCGAVPNNALCPPGQFCLAASGCAAGEPCSVLEDCDDGDACNGTEACEEVAPGDQRCVPGTPVVCDDDVDCSDDSCDPETGACVFTPQHGVCADTNLCNGSETCDLSLGCIEGEPLDCDDGVDCTDDNSCLPAAGCLNRPIDDLCQDGSACNGRETCDALLDCQEGTPLLCGSDGVDCTVDSCDDAAGGCVHQPDDSLCAPMTCSIGAQSLTCDAALGCGNHCSPATCQGKVYLCGDCKDNDGDCVADANDPECFGACDNNESGWKGEIPGQNQNPCQKMDCYFDQDNGAGNDDCYWAHDCDPLEPGTCNYDSNTSVPGAGASCSTLSTEQSATCTNFCAPLTPNGCDCFGCCNVQKGGNTYTVFLGSENASGNGSCNLAVADQPDKCHPCTRVPGCLNTCDVCELCLGKDELPPECQGQQSCGERTPCGLPGQAACAMGEFCLTGCCTSF